MSTLELPTYSGLFKKDSSCQTKKSDVLDFKSLSIEVDGLRDDLFKAKNYIQIDYETSIEARARILREEYLSRLKLIEKEAVSTIDRIRLAFKSKVKNSLLCVEQHYLVRIKQN